MLTWLAAKTGFTDRNRQPLEVVAVQPGRVTPGSGSAEVAAAAAAAAAVAVPLLLAC